MQYDFCCGGAVVSGAGAIAGAGNSAYDCIDRPALYRFFLSMKDQSKLVG